MSTKITVDAPINFSTRTLDAKSLSSSAESNKEQAGKQSYLLGDWKGVLLSMVRLCECDGGFISFVDVNDNRAWLLGAVGAEEAFFQIYAPNIALTNALIHLERAGIPPLAANPRLVSSQRNEARATPEPYRAWLVKKNMHYRLEISMVIEPGRLIYVELLRQRGKEPFPPSTEVSLRLLMDQVWRSRELRLRAGTLAYQYRLAWRLLNMLSAGIVLVRANSEILHRNRYARVVLNRSDGLLISRGRLVTSLKRSTDQLQRAIEQTYTPIKVGPSAARTTIRVERPSGGPPYALFVFHVGENMPLYPGTFKRASAAVVICDGKIDTTPDSETLRMLYGLTPTESRLAQEFARGHRLNEVAARFHISRHTARTHLKHIFEKTGADSQSALIRLMILDAGPLRAY